MLFKYNNFLNKQKNFLYCTLGAWEASHNVTGSSIIHITHSLLYIRFGYMSCPPSGNVSPEPMTFIYVFKSKVHSQNISSSNEQNINYINCLSVHFSKCLVECTLCNVNQKQSLTLSFNKVWGAKWNGRSLFCMSWHCIIFHSFYKGILSEQPFSFDYWITNTDFVSEMKYTLKSCSQHNTCD